MAKANSKKILGLRIPSASSALIDNVKVPFPCHSYGMVGFVKELVDEQGAASITRNCPVAEQSIVKVRKVRYHAVHCLRE